jgi:hypothetical protein
VKKAGRRSLFVCFVRSLAHSFGSLRARASCQEGGVGRWEERAVATTATTTTTTAANQHRRTSSIYFPSGADTPVESIRRVLIRLQNVSFGASTFPEGITECEYDNTASINITPLGL